MNLNKKIIAAVKGDEMFKRACNSQVDIIFDLLPCIETIESNLKICKENNKILFVHMDLAEGIGKDRAGIKYLKKLGVPGIISTRGSMIKTAREEGMMTVQRVFIIDSQSIESAEAGVRTKPDMVEIMPGIMPIVIEELVHKIDVPIIAGGLIKTDKNVEDALAAGAAAVSTTMEELWKN